MQLLMSWLNLMLDGIMASGSSYSAVSSRFCPLLTIRRTGDDAVIPTTREVGLDETYQISLIALTSIYSLQSTQDFVVKEQLVAVLYRPSPDPVRSVSGERIAPNRCSRIATLPFFVIGCGCGLTLALKAVLLTRNRLNSSVSGYIAKERGFS
jgi:hypothetical protein